MIECDQRVIAITAPIKGSLAEVCRGGSMKTVAPQNEGPVVALAVFLMRPQAEPQIGAA
jgi:hypothetical protein